MYKGIKKHRFTEQIPPNIPRTALMSGNTTATKAVIEVKQAVIIILAFLVKSGLP